MGGITEGEGYFKGVNDDKMYWRKWLPEGERKATVMIVHGVNEHIGRYMNVVNKLVPEGFAVYGEDHYGHGKSEGHRGYVKRFEFFIENLRIFFKNIVQKEADDKPIFIIGHSMGSIITMNFVRMYPDGLKGMVLSGTGSSTGNVSAILKLGAKILSAIAPKGSIDLPFPENWITRDEEVCKAWDTDPLTNDKTTFRLGNEMNRWLKKGYNGISEITMPALIQCGTDDAGFEGQKELFERVGAEDKTLKMYDKCRHEVYNEIQPERDIILNDLSEWLNSHM